METMNSKKTQKEEDSPSAPAINFQCVDAIHVSLFIEKQGRQFYQVAAQTTKNPKVKEIFMRLAREEEDHIQSLQAKAKFLQPALSKKSDSRDSVSGFIAEELKGKVFPEMSKNQMADFPQPKTDQEALEFGIQSEKRSIEVLSKLLLQERKIDVRVIFLHLLVEEKKHLAALEELKKTVFPSA